MGVNTYQNNLRFDKNNITVKMLPKNTKRKRDKCILPIY